MAQRTVACKECGWSCKNCSDPTNLHLHVEIENLKQRLLEREHHIVSMETNFLTEAEKFPNGEFAALTEELLTWQEKYSRLYESHKRVQKVNQSLEDKLLKIVDKCETEKTSLTKEVTNLTQKLVEAKGKINRLQDENERYRNDVNLAIQLLQCKPANFVSHKFDMLPSDLQQKVRTYVSNKRRPSDGNGNGGTNKPEPKTIKVPIPTFPPTAMVYSISKVPADKDGDVDEKSSSTKPPVDIVSAAIMAKVLEERERERLNTKHCDSCTCPQQAVVDVSTQASLITDQGILCVRCGSRCDGNVNTDASNRASQGLVRYVDVVTTRNSEITSRNISSGYNQQNDLLYMLEKNSCFSNAENCGKISKHSLEENQGSKDGGNNVIESARRNESLNGKISKSLNKMSENCKQNGGMCTKGSNNNNGKSSKEITKSGRSLKSVENSKSSTDNKQESEELDNSSHSPSTDNSDLPSSRVIFGNSMSQLNRIPKFPVKNNETYSMRIKNQEGRTYLSDVANSECKNNTDSTWTKYSSDNTLTKCTDRQTSGISCKVSSSVKCDSRSSSNKLKSSEPIPGPRHCSLRLQAGSSNILLDNATSYAPVLYTSRSGDISSTVLVHIPRSRSASASSTDDNRPSSWTQNPTETKL